MTTSDPIADMLTRMRNAMWTVPLFGMWLGAGGANAQLAGPMSSGNFGKLSRKSDSITWPWLAIFRNSSISG